LTFGRVSSRSAISSELDGSRLIGAFLRFFFGFSSDSFIGKKICYHHKVTPRKAHMQTFAPQISFAAQNDNQWLTRES
jgi:hypothetical protein